MGWLPRIILLMLVSVLFSGCTSTVIHDPGPTVTVQATPTAATTSSSPTNIAVNWVYNYLGQDVELRLSAYTLDANGQASYPYATTSIRANGATNNAGNARTAVGPEAYPACDSRMQGLRLILLTISNSQKIREGSWPGVHCTGSATNQGFVICSAQNILFGQGDSGNCPTSSSQSPTSSTTPSLAITVDDTMDRLTVVSAGSGADWSRLSAVASVCTATSTINSGGSGTTHQNMQPSSASRMAVSSAGCTGTNTPVQISASSIYISAGDFLGFCATSVTSSSTRITITDTVSSTIIGQYTFSSIALCT